MYVYTCTFKTCHSCIYYCSNILHTLIGHMVSLYDIYLLILWPFTSTAIPHGSLLCNKQLIYEPIYEKNPSEIFSRTSGGISMKHGMQLQGPKPIIVCLNDDHGLTLTYFTARSNFTSVEPLQGNWPSGYRSSNSPYAR